MTDELLNKFFEQARNQSSETKVEEIASWVSVAAGAGAVGLLSQLKFKLLTKKGIMYLGSIFLGVGIGVTALIGLKEEENNSNSSRSDIAIEKSNSRLESAILFDSIEDNKTEKGPSIPPKLIQSDKQMPIDKLPISPVFPMPLIPDFILTPPRAIQPKVLRKGIEIQEREVGIFTKLNVTSTFDVEIIQGASRSLRVEASDKVINEISTKIVGDELIISLTKNYKSNTDGDLKVFITVVDLNEIILSGAVKLKSKGDISSEKFKIKTSGACDIELTIKSKSVYVDCSGASNLILNGTTSLFTLQTSGSTKAICSDLDAETVDIESSGASDVYCRASSKLNVHATGASKIRYEGSPKEIDINSSGAASIKKL